ncbi:hypothetical protein [Pseudomonas kuykendallii]|uniref:hypothetical protein n=1 Tax=Pseudomonas kuykendallii TaxID=1007099 RepID=UPI0028D81FC3|nr:hypothetical protein [Pseudomonas kuykendallii]
MTTTHQTCSYCGYMWEPGEPGRHSCAFYLKATVERLEAEVKRLDLPVHQTDFNYDMSLGEMRSAMTRAMLCLEEWNRRYPRLAKRGAEDSSQWAERELRRMLPGYREAMGASDQEHAA